MKSLIVKRSVVIDGHKTSVSVEDAFWGSLKKIAARRRLTLSALPGTFASMGLPHFERVAPQIIAVELDQVEGIEEHVRVMVPVPDAIEGCHPVFAARHRLPVDDAGTQAQPGERIGDEREALGVGAMARARAWAAVRSVSLISGSRGPPSFTPRALAAASPALVRSQIILRSSCATAAYDHESIGVLLLDASS
jgi:hypothetical protein